MGVQVEGVQKSAQEAAQENGPLFGDAGHARHAVVVGGSMGGLLAARILADYFEKVTVVDRDTFPQEPEHRKGVPQSHHAHGLPRRGKEIIEQLFPGSVAELLEAGAPPGAILTIVAPAGKLASVESLESVEEEGEAGKEERRGKGGFEASRFLLEWTVRRRVAALRAVNFISAAEVVDLTSTPDGSRITGVRLRPRSGASDTSRPTTDVPEILEADLVVDASGRRSKAPRWLQKLGYDAPPEETINSGLGYASRFYEKPENFPEEWEALTVNARPPDNPRAGIILPIEDGKWHVTLSGYAENYPPTDEEGFMQWARDLPDPSIYESIRIAKPVSPIRGYRTPTNRLRHFEKLDRQPERFIATGDSVAAFNPIYGQGMTTSALDALVLDESLREQRHRPKWGFEARFQKDISSTVAAPWLSATGEDLRWEGVEIEGSTFPGKGLGMPVKNLGTKITHRYIDLLLRRAVKDAVVSKAFLDVMRMFARPSSLLKPGVALRVLRGALSGALAPEPDSERANSTVPQAFSAKALASIRNRPVARPFDRNRKRD